MRRTCCQGPLGAHLCQKEKPPPFWQTHGLQAVDDARARHEMGVGDVRPVGDLVDTISVLGHHSVADISKLPVLKDKEGCRQFLCQLPRYDVCLQRRGCRWERFRSLTEHVASAQGESRWRALLTGHFRCCFFHTSSRADTILGISATTTKCARCTRKPNTSDSRNLSLQDCFAGKRLRRWLCLQCLSARACNLSAMSWSHRSNAST